MTRPSIITQSRIDALKICSIRETVEETGILPISQSIYSLGTSSSNNNNLYTGNFGELLEKLKISNLLKTVNVYPWIMWRTPDCPDVYPQRWDMLVSVSFLDDETKTGNENQFKVNQFHESNEALTIEWLEINEILFKNSQNTIKMAPPQWYFIKMLQKLIPDLKQFQSDLKLRKNSFPKLIDPKLISDQEGLHWQSVLSEADKYYNRPDINVKNILIDKIGPFHRILMKRHVGGNNNEKYFYDFQLLE